MKLFFLLGFRNIFRNLRRTLLTASVISIALCSLMLMDGFMVSMRTLMIKLQTSTYMGEAQIHPSNYKENDDLGNTLKSPEALETYLKQEPLIQAYSPRVLANGMLSSSYESQIVRVVGVDFDLEKNVSKIKSSIVQGEYPEGKETERTLILGHSLAKKLRSELGERVILTYSQEGSSDVSQEMFRLSGVVQFNMRPYDDLFIFIDSKKAREMFGLGLHDSHEISLYFANRDVVGKLDEPVRQKIGKLGSLYENWGELAKALKSMLEMTQFSMAFIYSLVFIFILFAILNTMFMSIFERSFEFGVMKALGTKGWQVAYMILCECFSLGVLGAFFGCLMGLVLIFYLNLNGISYAGSEFNGISLSEPLKPAIRLYQFTGIPLSIIGITILSGIYPAFHAARMSVASSMRKSL